MAKNPSEIHDMPNPNKIVESRIGYDPDGKARQGIHDLVRAVASQISGFEKEFVGERPEHGEGNKGISPNLREESKENPAKNPLQGSHTARIMNSNNPSPEGKGR